MNSHGWSQQRSHQRFRAFLHARLLMSSNCVLFQLEMRNANEKFGIKNPRYLRKTIFKVQKSGAGFVFKVVNQIRRELPT